MTITVKRIDGATFEVVNGHHRLTVGLEVAGVVQVTDIETGDTMDVKMADGKMVVMEAGASALAGKQAGELIMRAMTKAKGE